jgi:hypothetical protein
MNDPVIVGVPVIVAEFVPEVNVSPGGKAPEVMTIL